MRVRAVDLNSSEVNDAEDHPRGEDVQERHARDAALQDVWTWAREMSAFEQAHGYDRLAHSPPHLCDCAAKLIRA